MADKPVLSNVEFEKLSSDQSSRLKVWAKKRCDTNPKGFIYLGDIDRIAFACRSSGDHKAYQWLNNLRMLATSGKLEQLRSGNETRDDKIREVRRLRAQNKVPFDINDHIMLKDTGKRGTVVDYIPSTNEFVVVLSPFQFLRLPAKELAKTATKAPSKWLLV